MAAWRLGGDLTGIEAVQFGGGLVDLDHDGVAGGAKPVLDLHDALDLADGVRQALRALVQQAGIGPEQLDLDGLGHGGEIPDGVLHQLRGLDFQAGDMGLNVLPDLGHHLVDRRPLA